MRILILEDDSSRITAFIEKFHTHELTITENAHAAIDYLTDNEYDYIFLDNDLGYNNGSGIDVAQFLNENLENTNNKATIIIHSWNTPASKCILSMLHNARRVPYNSTSFFAITIDK